MATLRDLYNKYGKPAANFLGDVTGVKTLGQAGGQALYNQFYAPKQQRQLDETNNLQRKMLIRRLREEKDPVKRQKLSQILTKSSIDAPNVFRDTLEGAPTSRQIAGAAFKLGTVAIPGAGLGRIAKMTPVPRLIGSGLVRGAEGAGIQAGGELIEGRPVRDVVRDVPRNVLTGGLINTALSPKLTGRAAKAIGNDVRASTIPDPITGKLPTKPGFFMGQGAKGWDTAKGKFTSRFDKKVRAEGSDAGAKIKKPVTAGKSHKLGDVFEHDELYSRYPDLKNIEVRGTSKVAGGGGFDPKGNVIYFDPNLNEDQVRKTILHELQHAIQTKEHFAAGANPKAYESDDLQELKLARRRGKIGTGEYVKELLRLEGKSVDKYNRTAGEIEARSVEARADLTPEQRQTSQPYGSEGIRPEDAIVNFDPKTFAVKKPLPPGTVARPQPGSTGGGLPRRALTGRALDTPSAKLRPQAGQEGVVRSLDDIVTNDAGTPVGKKVNLLDFVRTPNRVLEKIGLKKESDEIRAAYEKYQQELPDEIKRLDAWKSQVTQDGNVRIFKFLDGQIDKAELTPPEQKVATEVKTYLEGWADRLNLPQDKRITNYITHIFDQELIQKEFPDEIANLIQDKVAGSVYDPFTEQRLGKLGYIEDTFRALEAYVKRAARKANLDPALEKVKAASEKLEQSQFKYVKNYIDRLNMRPTDIDNLIDNTIKATAGYKFGVRPTANLTRKARQIVYRGTLGLNVGSALKNLSQGANTYARLGERFTVTGYVNMVKNMANGSDELTRVGILRDDFIQDRILSTSKKTLQAVDKGLFAFFEFAEKVNRGAAYYGAKAKALHEGLDEIAAVEYGKKVVRDTQFTFGAIDTPPILQSDTGKLLGQFQSYTLKQGEFLGEMIAAKDIAGLARWAGASMLFVYSAGKLIGMEPKDMIPSLRIGVPPALQLPYDLAKAAFGGEDKYGNDVTVGDAVKKSLPLVIPGGVQGKKTYEGLSSALKGYSETAKGQVRFPVEPGIGNQIKGAVFGQYSFPEARNYFKEEEKPLSQEQSALFKAGGAAAGLYDQIIGNRQVESSDNDMIKALKGEKVKGKGKVGKPTDLGDGLVQLPSGKFARLVDGEAQKYDTAEEAYLAIQKEKFKKSGKAIQVVDDMVYRRSKSGEITVETKLGYDYKVNQNKLQAYKAADNYKEWLKLADTQFKNLQEQLNDPTLDELEITDLQEKARILIESYQKYKSYGGRFKKGRKGRKGKKANVTMVNPPKLGSGTGLANKSVRAPDYSRISGKLQPRAIIRKPRS